MSAELLNALDQINSNANRLIGAVTDDQWSAQTPCTEWTVRDLVNHMTGTTNFLHAAASRGEPTAGPDADHLGDDPAAAFRTAAARTMAAWRADGALDGMVTLPAEMPAIAALGVNVIDTGTHCWDLAQAIGAEHGLSDELIGTIDHWNRQVVSDEVRSGGGFGEQLETGSADGMTAMLGFVGRKG